MKCDQCFRDLPRKEFLITADESFTRRSICGRCGLMNLAGHSEHIEPGDTLAEIAQGEQTGAFFRRIAGEMA